MVWVGTPREKFVPFKKEERAKEWKSGVCVCVCSSQSLRGCVQGWPYQYLQREPPPNSFRLGGMEKTTGHQLHPGLCDSLPLTPCLVLEWYYRNPSETSEFFIKCLKLTLPEILFVHFHLLQNTRVWQLQLFQIGIKNIYTVYGPTLFTANLNKKKQKKRNTLQ